MEKNIKSVMFHQGFGWGLYTLSQWHTEIFLDKFNKPGGKDGNTTVWTTVSPLGASAGSMTQLSHDCNAPAPHVVLGSLALEIRKRERTTRKQKHASKKIEAQTKNQSKLNDFTPSSAGTQKPNCPYLGPTDFLSTAQFKYIYGTLKQGRQGIYIYIYIHTWITSENHIIQIKKLTHADLTVYSQRIYNATQFPGGGPIFLKKKCYEFPTSANKCFPLK